MPRQCAYIPDGLLIPASIWYVYFFSVFAISINQELQAPYL